MIRCRFCGNELLALYRANEEHPIAVAPCRDCGPAGLPLDYAPIEQGPEELDEGVRELVALLRRQLFETTDSGDGVSKPEDERMSDVPHVIMTTSREYLFQDADRLRAVLREAIGDALTPGMIQATFDPVDESATLAVFGVDDAMLRRA